jgi:Xaa-Pro aminopeptidase
MSYMDAFARRREQLARSLSEEGLDACLISSPINVSYLTGFSGDSSYLIVRPDRALLVSDARFTEQLAEECPGLETYIRPPTQRPLSAVAATLERLGQRTVGFESAALTVAEFDSLRDLAPALDWKGGSDRVERLRVIKDDDELRQIREAIVIAERAYTALVAMLDPDDTERGLCDAMEGYLRKAGGKGSSFSPIIAAGPRAALPHAPPTTQKIGGGEVLLVDWGAAGRFYKSDLTRVLDTRRNGAILRGGSRIEEVHALVARAHQEALRQIRPGVKAHDVDAAARRVIADAGHGGHFGHGLGHGIGLQVHEAPAIRPNSETVLQAGMVFTVEPGVYLPGWGGVRLEDDVLVTPDGCEVLTHLPRDLCPAFAG